MESQQISSQYLSQGQASSNKLSELFNTFLQEFCEVNERWVEKFYAILVKLIDLTAQLKEVEASENTEVKKLREELEETNRLSEEFYDRIYTTLKSMNPELLTQSE
mmetsp:Transcript_40415/g.46322  ORF Transcript_40415/g.46322 Transcript_40415/m.46322 type:complete len:106 (+) Transcript_40415:461-778(+)